MLLKDSSLYLVVDEVFVALYGKAVSSIARMRDELVFTAIKYASFVVRNIRINRSNANEDVHPVIVFLGHNNK